MKKLKKNLSSIIKLGTLLTGLILGQGCAKTTVYVLQDSEFVPLSKGQTFTAQCDGTFYSSRAETRIMNVEVKAAKK